MALEVVNPAPPGTSERRSTLEGLDLLKFLPPDVRRLVVGSFVPATFAFGDVIVREGDRADGFFVLATGKARVVKAGHDGAEVSLHVLRPGDSFGEIGLLEPKATRTATVRASSDVEAFRLDKTVFDALLEFAPEIRACLELHLKHRSLHTFFRLYTPFTKLPPAVLGRVIGQFEEVGVEKGELVIRQGDLPGPLYVVEEGRLRVFVEEEGKRRYLGYLRKGDIFGERSVFKGQPRAASVEAFSPCRLLSLRPSAFQVLASEQPEMAAEIERHIAQHDYKDIARVPLDFAEELVPADARVEEVGPDQVDLAEDESVPFQAGPFASPGGLFVKKKVLRIRRFPFVRQIDQMDCGAACLAMVCRYFGRAVSLARIRRLLFTSTDGTSLRALCRGAEEMGLAARSVKASARNLAEMPLPAIIHWGGNHWVVLYAVDEGVVRIADPGLGLRRLPREELQRKWTGYAALFDYTKELEKAPAGRSSATWLGEFFRPHAGVLGKAAALALIVSALQMVLPVFTQVVVDRVLVEQGRGPPARSHLLDGRRAPLQHRGHGACSGTC